MVDLELYRIFKIVAEEENITEASKRLNISQPAVTKHIHNLENILGINLFERTNRGLKLNEVGNKIYSDIINPINILESIYTKYRESRAIYLGIHHTMLEKLFSKKLSEFYSKYEKISVNIVNNDLLEMLEKLENMQLSMVISKKAEQYNKEKLEFISMGFLNDVLVVDRKSPLLKEKINIENIKEKTIYMPRKTSKTVKNFYESTNCKEEDFKNIKNISYNVMIEMVKNSNCIGLATKEYIQKELKEGEIIELKTEFKLKPVEYGIYLNKELKFKKLTKLINELM